MPYTLEPMQPFGAVIRNTQSHAFADEIPVDELYSLVRQYKLLVFRGFHLMEKKELALFAQRLGEPLQWVFGAINELRVKPDAENYIFTDHEVPMHWDGAFAGKIPHLILFQCIVAPAKEDMGGTTFADTRAILENIPAETRKNWEEKEITYTTKKIVHYGGSIRQKLIAGHPVDGNPVMRYAEPVDDLNPVKVEVHGLKPDEQAEFISEMKSLLYDPRHLLTHRWEAGDLVIADNHCLLHGREAFRKANERYIQRINILHRPKPNWRRSLRNNLLIRRKEFFKAEIPIFLIPLLLLAGSLNDLLKPELIIGLGALILLFNLGDIINCYADYELDAVGKSHLSNAVYELGKKNIKGQLIVSGLLALMLTVGAAFMADRQYLIPLTLFGGLTGLQYSVGPFRFKSRGFYQLLCLWGIIFFGPMLYAAIIVQGFPPWKELFLFASFGFHQMGIILLNTSEDYEEDKKEGLRTIVVSMGLKKAIRFALNLVLVSGLLMQAMQVLIFRQYGAPWYLYTSVFILTAGWLIILAEFRDIWLKIKNVNEDEALRIIRKNGMKVPRWLNIGAYATLAVVAACFAWRILQL